MSHDLYKLHTVWRYVCNSKCGSLVYQGDIRLQKGSGVRRVRVTQKKGEDCFMDCPTQIREAHRFEASFSVSETMPS